MGEVVNFHTEDAWVGDGVAVPVDGVLQGAKEADLTQVAIVGRTSDGEFYLAGSNGAVETLFLLQQASHTILNNSLGDE